MTLAHRFSPLILCFKRFNLLTLSVFLLFFVSLFPAVCFPGEDESVGTIKEFGDISSEVLDYVKEALSKFQAPPTSVTLPSLPGPNGENLKIEVPGFSNSKGNARDSGCNPESSVYYFFSFSMPQESIGIAIEDALRINAACEKKVTLVLRGLIENNLKATIKKFYALMKERKIQGDWPVTIDPPLFEKYGITEVPTLVMEKAATVSMSLSGSPPG